MKHRCGPKYGHRNNRDKTAAAMVPTEEREKEWRHPLLPHPDVVFGRIFLNSPWESKDSEEQKETTHE